MTTLTERFEEQRGRLRAIALRMLGSPAEADDALQEAWLRIRDQDPAAVVDARAWLTTVVGRVCLNMLRSRKSRREEPSDVHVPDPVVTIGPEQEVLLADSVGLAMLVVLDALTPAERLAFVLHDVFGVPFSEIADVLGRSEPATQQLASRARRRVGTSPEPDRDPTRQRRIVDAFFAAARDGNFDALVQLLHPDVVLRIDGGKLRRDASAVRRGKNAVASHTRTYSGLYPYVVPAFVNNTAGAIIVPHGRPFAVMAFTFAGDTILRIDVLTDPERLERLDLGPRQEPRV
jgi:RNA polymerase sigma-70 factor (ECF subfamily)